MSFKFLLLFTNHDKTKFFVNVKRLNQLPNAPYDKVYYWFEINYECDDQEQEDEQEGKMTDKGKITDKDKITHLELESMMDTYRKFRNGSELYFIKGKCKVYKNNKQYEEDLVQLDCDSTTNTIKNLHKKIILFFNEK